MFILMERPIIGKRPKETASAQSQHPEIAVWEAEGGAVLNRIVTQNPTAVKRIPQGDQPLGHDLIRWATDGGPQGTS